MLSQSDFSGRVVNNDHFLYWGDIVKTNEEGMDFHIQVGILVMMVVVMLAFLVMIIVMMGILMMMLTKIEESHSLHNPCQSHDKKL